MKYTHDLTGKTAVVTGAGGILCSDFAALLAENGAEVALLDLNLEAAQKAADRITAAGGKAIAVKANVLEKDSLEEAKKQVLDAFGKVDILINGAGGNNPKGTSDDEFYTDESAKESVKSFFELDQAGIQFVLNLNFMGTLLPTQTFAPLMLNKNGVIINISSMNAYRPLTKIPAYSGAKAAISNFTQYLAVYFAKAGIRVNAIAPGFFVTHQNRGLLFNEDGTPTARTGKILNATPMGRFGEASELGGTLMWLVDNEAASFVTGIVVPVDGGFSAYSGV
ncbi:MAG: SDR family oxidoreductase [Clostridia bacterium]|jgi:NAD(P)-dependent dehydrogenase (short-subunit alcohol dehydrogenase family)|nr:SDR family oxidoreductase [Clostridia bacterium]